MVIQKKIMFAGLDNSGKTSLIFSFQKKFSFMNSAPTMGLERSSITSSSLLGLNFVAWDMGGQGRFRKRYFEKKYHIFSNTSVLFYIIDIMDHKRFDETAGYLRRILDVFDLIDEKPLIIICFHKFDPDIKNDVHIIKKITNLKERFREVSSIFNVKFHETSIHDIATVYKLFSEGIMKSSPVSQLISAQLKIYSKITSSLAVSLLSADMLIIGNHSKQKYLLDICEKIGPKFLYTMSEIKEIQFTSQQLILNVSFNISAKRAVHNKQFAVLFMQSFEICEGEILNIVTLAKTKKTYQLSMDYLPKLATRISNILKIAT